MQCTGNMRCPGTDADAVYTTEKPCIFKRKLCVTCSTKDDPTVYITVQQNSMPNHCFYSTVNFGVAADNEWEVVFNADMSGIENYSADDIATSAKTDELLCDL